MNKLIIVLILLPAVAIAAPSVPSVGGIISSGETITITGSSFGVKPMAPPKEWQQFEDGAVHHTPISADGWYGYSGGDGSWYANDFSYSGNFSANHRVAWRTDDVGYNRSYYEYSPTDTIFVMVKSRLEGLNLGATVFQWKNDRITGGSGPYNGPGFKSNETTDLGETLPISTHDQWDGGLVVADVWDGYTKFTTEHWMTFEYSFALSDIGASTGGVIRYRRFWDAGDTRAAYLSGKDVRPVENRQEAWNFKYYMLGTMFSSLTTDYADISIYVDDVYIDDTWARVVLGDANTYDSCRKLEMQIPLTWSTSSITATCNTGTFVNGDTAYLYVIDLNGNISPASSPLTVSSEYDPPPPATTITRPDSLKVE